MLKNFAIALIVALISLQSPIQAQTLKNGGVNQRIQTSAKQNWLTLNDEKMCAAQVFFVNDMTLVYLREKATGIYYMALQDRSPSVDNNIEGVQVQVSAAGTLFGTATFNDTEMISFEVSETFRAAFRGAHTLRVQTLNQPENIVLHFELTGSALADYYVQECDKTPPGPDPHLVPQRPLEQVPEQPINGGVIQPVPSNGATIQSGNAMNSKIQGLLKR